MNLRHLALVAVLLLLVAGCATLEPTADPAVAEPTLNLPTAVNLNVTPWAPITAAEGVTSTGVLTSTGGLTTTERLTVTEVVTPGVLAPGEVVPFAVPPEMLSVLENRTYILDGRPYTLTNGAYANAADRTSVTLSPPGATGDLNADGVDDAVIVVALDAGGTGVFKHLAAVVDDAGQWVGADPVPLGDRVRIDGIVVQDGVVLLDVVTHGPSDPMCCPTLQQTWAFQLVDGKLQLVSADGPQATG